MKKTYLHIPRPCHEDWEAMTNEQQGKFCNSCCKTVIDFTAMSDAQILATLHKASGKTCGRFTDEQLQRPLQKQAETYIPYKFFLKAFIPAFLMGNTGLTQMHKGNKAAPQIACKVGEKLIGDTIIQQTENPGIMMGKIAFHDPLPATRKEIKGRVVDNQGNPVPYATIGYNNSVMAADSFGEFSIKIKSGDTTFAIVASHVGYNTIEKIFTTRNITGAGIEIQMQPNALLGEVIVTAESRRWITGMMGGLVSVVSVSRLDTTTAWLKKLLHLQAFNVYPNPAAKGGTLTMIFRVKGDYDVQLFNQAGQLFLQHHMAIATDAGNALLTLPAEIAAGMYYLKSVHASGRKPFIYKIIIR